MEHRVTGVPADPGPSSIAPQEAGDVRHGGDVQEAGDLVRMSPDRRRIAVLSAATMAAVVGGVLLLPWVHIPAFRLPSSPRSPTRVPTRVGSMLRPARIVMPAAEPFGRLAVIPPQPWTGLSSSLEAHLEIVEPATAPEPTSVSVAPFPPPGAIAPLSPSAHGDDNGAPAPMAPLRTTVPPLFPERAAARPPAAAGVAVAQREEPTPKRMRRLPVNPRLPPSLMPEE